jgi:hypothetical protein
MITTAFGVGVAAAAKAAATFHAAAHAAAPAAMAVKHRAAAANDASVDWGHT